MRLENGIEITLPGASAIRQISFLFEVHIGDECTLTKLIIEDAKY